MRKVMGPKFYAALIAAHTFFAPVGAHAASVPDSLAAPDKAVATSTAPEPSSYAKMDSKIAPRKGGLMKRGAAVGHIVPSRSGAPSVGQKMPSGDDLYLIDIGTPLAKADDGASQGRSLFAVEGQLPQASFAGADEALSCHVVGSNAEKDIAILPGDRKDYTFSQPESAEDVSGYHGPGSLDARREIDGRQVKVSLHNLQGVIFAGDQSPSQIAKSVAGGDSPESYQSVSMEDLRKSANLSGAECPSRPGASQVAAFDDIKNVPP